MKKVIRLTESDLVRIVKRVIKEQDNTFLNEMFMTPFYGFITDIRSKGLTYVMGDKNQNILPNEGHMNPKSYYIYVGKGGDKNWIYTKFDEENINSLRDLKNPAWKSVTNNRIINDLNRIAVRISDTTYSVLERNPEVSRIVDMIKSGKRTLNDAEAYPEAAFMAIDSKQKYNQVKKMLGKDPYQYVKSFMDTSKVYHKKSIDSSMRRLGLL